MTSNIKLQTSNFHARVAKLVDALSSGGSIRKVVLVRIQSRAQEPRHEVAGLLILERREHVRFSWSFGMESGFLYLRRVYGCHKQ